MTTTERAANLIPAGDSSRPAQVLPAPSATAPPLRARVPHRIGILACTSALVIPLVVLLVTTAAGLVVGVGLIVPAAPLAAVISRITRRLAAARHEPVEPLYGR